MAKKKRTKASKAYRQAKRLQARVAQEQAVLAQRREAARREAVGNGLPSEAPPEEHVSVRTVPSAVESSRRRH